MTTMNENAMVFDWLTEMGIIAILYYSFKL